MADLTAITDRFPEQELAIRRHVANDPEFAELCDDYTAATRALDRWKADAAKTQEYRELIAELEDDLARYLEKQRPKPA